MIFSSLNSNILTPCNHKNQTKYLHLAVHASELFALEMLFTESLLKHRNSLPYLAGIQCDLVKYILFVCLFFYNSVSGYE